MAWVLEERVLDTVAVPGGAPASTPSAMMADEAAFAVMDSTPTAVRLIHAVGLGVGGVAELGGLPARPRPARHRSRPRGSRRPREPDPRPVHPFEN